MQYPQFLEELRKKAVYNTYLFFGEEEFLKLEALEGVEKMLREKGVEEKVVFEGDVSAAALSETLNTPPLLSKSRLIIVKSARGLNEDCREVLSGHLKNPSSNFLVIFLEREDVKEWSVPGRGAAFVEFKKFYEGDILAWLINRARCSKKILGREAAKIFLEQVGGELPLLSQALERVINYVGQKNTIEPGDAEAVLADEKIEAIFDLTDAMAAKDLGSCLSILNKLFLAFTPPQQIIGLLSFRIRQLYALKCGAKLGIPPFFLKRLREQAQGFPQQQLERCLCRLRELDARIKEGAGSPRFLLELFFFRFLEQGKANT